MTLIDLNKKMVAEVAGFTGTPSLMLRLAKVGLRSKQKIRLLRSAPFQGPLLIEEMASGGKMMVAKSLAQNVLVRLVDG